MNLCLYVLYLLRESPVPHFRRHFPPSFFFSLPPPRKNKFTDVDSSASQVLAYRGTSSRVLSYVYPAFNRRRRRRRYFTPLPSPSLSFSLRSLSRYLYGELRYSPESREQLSGRRHSYLLGRRRSGDLNDIRARARARVCMRVRVCVCVFVKYACVSAFMYMKRDTEKDGRLLIHCALDFVYLTRCTIFTSL